MSLALLQPVACCAAFWTAQFLYTRRARPARLLRFTCALALGAALAHAGWLLLHAPLAWAALGTRPGLLLDPSFGFCVLFVPLGPLLLERSTAAFASLPLALAVARLGCLAAGCCHGTPAAAPWAMAGLHPTALYEIAGLLALHGGVSRAGGRFAAPLVLGGVAALRLLLEPLRAIPPLGAPIITPSAVAVAWLAIAAGLAWRESTAIVPCANGRDLLLDAREATCHSRPPPDAGLTHGETACRFSIDSVSARSRALLRSPR